jgi:hypothetical protein
MLYTIILSDINATIGGSWLVVPDKRADRSQLCANGYAKLHARERGGMLPQAPTTLVRHPLTYVRVPIRTCIVYERVEAT